MVGRVFFFCGCATRLGITFHRPGIEPGPLAVKSRSLNRWSAREFPDESSNGKVLCHSQVATSSLIHAQMPPLFTVMSLNTFFSHPKPG